MSLVSGSEDCSDGGSAFFAVFDAQPSAMLLTEDAADVKSQPKMLAPLRSTVQLFVGPIIGFDSSFERFLGKTRPVVCHGQLEEPFPLSDADLYPLLGITTGVGH